MITPPTAPSPGKPVSASFFARLISWVKSGQLVEGVGYRLSRTPNGTSLELLAGTTKGSAALPWSFSCKEDKISGERTGGWSNCILQLGYDKFFSSEDINYIGKWSGGAYRITGTDATEDGDYFVEIDLAGETARILKNDGSINPQSPHDPEHNLVRIWIGEVEDGKLVYGIHHHPVVYKYA